MCICKNEINVDKVIGIGFNSLRKRQKFRLVKIENICMQQNKCDSKREICFGKGRKHSGKRRKCWLTHYQMTNFRLFQTDRVCRRQFQI